MQDKNKIGLNNLIDKYLESKEHLKQIEQQVKDLDWSLLTFNHLLRHKTSKPLLDQE